MKVAVFVLLAVLAAGCKPATTESALGTKASVLVPQFSPKHGLFLPEETRRALGLELVEVSERKVRATLALELRVYQASGASALASGMVTPEKARVLQPGRQLEARMGDGRAAAAKVCGLNDQLQTATGLVEVLVEISKPQEEVTVGDFIRATAKLDSGESVGTVPRSALLGCSEGQFVYTVSGEHLVRSPVKVGATTDEFVEITDGLYAGDQVVSQPVISLWLTELAAVKGGQACCVEPPKGK